MSDMLTENPTGTANDIVMSKEMAEALHAAYPGHLWAVTCDGQVGFADVRNLYLSGNWGFRIKLDKVYSGSDFKRQVVMAGGELRFAYVEPDGPAGLLVELLEMSTGLREYLTQA